MSNYPDSSPVRQWQTISSEEIADCRIFSVRKNRRRNAEGDKQGEFFTLHSRDWMNVLALTPEMECILIRQYRHGSDEISLEVVGGIVDEGESPIDAARRELAEETGYRPGTILPLGKVRPNPAILDNWLYYFVALDAIPAGNVKFDEHEEIEVVRLSLPESFAAIRNGDITHSYSIEALLLFGMLDGEGGKSR